jgi:hypothetical protein
MSTGSTEPKLIFTLVNSDLGLGLSNRLGKAELAAGIAEAAGFVWEPDFETVFKRPLCSSTWDRGPERPRRAPGAVLLGLPST